MDDDLVTRWFKGLAPQLESDAAQLLWQRYYGRLVRLARQELGNASRRVADEEDVVVSAFRSFCSGVENGRFPHLDDPDDLWKLLVTITTRKAINHLRFQQRLKRGGGRVRGESAFENDAGPCLPGGIGQVLGREPTPEFAASLADECRQFLDQLEGPLRQIALMRMENYTEAEIAKKVGCSLSTVKRRVRIIRGLLQSVGDS